MSNNIMQSVLNMTEQNNIEALEHNLPASIAALLPIKSLSIYKAIPHNNFTEVEEVVKFLVQEHEPMHLWSAETVIEQSSQNLQDCLEQGVIKEISRPESCSTLYYPIVIDGRSKAALKIDSPLLNKDQRSILDGMANLYRDQLSRLYDNENDKLTGLLNRNTFDQRFDKLVEVQKNPYKSLWEEYEHPEKRKIDENNQIFLGIIDIDDFKHVNDSYGHIYGDEILLIVANILRESFRRSDILFRFGGGQFVVLLEPTTIEDAQQVLEKCRLKVERYAFPQIEQLTVSIGYTAIKDGSYAQTVCSLADKALQCAKMDGRNCTHSYQSLIKVNKLSPFKKSGSVEIFS